MSKVFKYYGYIDLFILMMSKNTHGNMLAEFGRVIFL